MNTSCAIVLAGGLGKRMKSDLPKPAHHVGGKSMLQHVVDKLNVDKIFIVFGQKGDQLKASIKHQENIIWVHQDPQLGTGHAVQVAFQEVKRHYTSDVQILVCNGDAPFIREKTFQELFSNKQNYGTLLTCVVQNPHGYGRIEMKDNQFWRIVEEKDCNDNQRLIKNINAGAYCFTYEALDKYIMTLKDNNAQKEFYLTDMMGILVENNHPVGVVEINDENEIFNINSREQLEEANKLFTSFSA